jgi:large subunit ribosomal protein L10
MALSRNKKNEVLDEVGTLLESSKLTVLAAYTGTSVKELQQLRRDAKGNGTSIKVVKNRLVIKALSSNERLKGTDTSALKGQILYAFNSEDEVAPAQVLATFAKTAPTLQFVGGITADGTFIGAEEIKALALLPGKNQLIAQVMATLSSPLDGVMNGLSGNLHALLDGIEAKATA